MKKIKLSSRGLCVIVDDEDYPVLSRFSWQDSNGFIGTDLNLITGTVRVPISKFIYGQSQNSTHNVGRYKAFHLNGDYYDCRKENMKMLSYIEENGRRGKEQGENRKYTSIYRGVSLQKNTGRWQAKLNMKNTSISKTFKTEKEAGIFWNKIAREYFGESAYQNKIV